MNVFSRTFSPSIYIVLSQCLVHLVFSKVFYNFCKLYQNCTVEAFDVRLYQDLVEENLFILSFQWRIQGGGGSWGVS